MNRIVLVAVLGLLGLAALSMSLLALLILKHAEVEAAILIAFTAPVSSAVGAVAGMIAMKHVSGGQDQ